MGKDSPFFQRHNLDASSSSVHVFNTDLMKFTGKKLDQKLYYRHSGYPGGLKSINLKSMMEKDSAEVLKKAVEMGMKNHEFVPVPLIESIASLKRSNTYKLIQILLKHKLIMHTSKNYDGYALTYMVYDYLALKVFKKRNLLDTIGT